MDRGGNSSTEPTQFSPPPSQQQQQQQPQAPQGSAEQPMSTAEAEAALNEVTELFYSGNPKHALSGAGEAARNVATGATLGLTSLVGSTIAGAQQGGLWGGVKGAGGGLLGLVSLTGYGAYTGARQFARGLYNTPEAVSQASTGEQLWDSSIHQWVTVALANDLAELPANDDDLRRQARQRYRAEIERREREGGPPPNGGSGPQGSPAAPNSTGTATGTARTAPTAGTTPGVNAEGEVTDFYLFLGVERAAARTEIKRAFTRKALEMHPDKNPDDPRATAKFQELLHAYSVLSNDVARAEYDRTGRISNGSMPAADANPMEDVLGLGPLEPLVGHLRFATYFEPDTIYDRTMLTELHRRRRLRIAHNLVNYLDNVSTGFESASFALRDAAATRVGPELITFAAESYRVASRQHLYGSAWQREADSWFTSTATQLSTTLGVFGRGATTVARAAMGRATEDDALRLLVAANESDVRRTVLQACRLVLYDVTASQEQRWRRAVRLGELSDLAIEEVRREQAARKAVEPQVQAS